MKKWIYFILILTGLSVYCVSYSLNSDPVSMLQSVADQMIASLKANKATLKNNRSLVYSLANKIVVPHADIQGMAKRVLPPRIWNNATDLEKSQFEHEFTALLVRTYASALANYTDQTVNFYPVRGGYEGKTDVKVDSQIIRTDGPPITINYRLWKVGSEWKLYDLIVEGVSMLESFRSQFASQLSHGDIMSLIKVLSRHNSLRSGNNE